MDAAPIRPVKNERKYSTVCSFPSTVRGKRISLISPSSITQPLAMRTTPPTATTVLSCRNGVTIRTKASFSSTESASIETTTGYREKLMPAFNASALPPLSLSTTIRLAY
jgi:hypothetical protein